MLPAFPPSVAHRLSQRATKIFHAPGPIRHASGMAGIYPKTLSMFRRILSAHWIAAATILSVPGLSCGPPNRSSAVSWCRATMIPAMIASTTHLSAVCDPEELARSSPPVLQWPAMIRTVQNFRKKGERRKCRIARDMRPSIALPCPRSVL